MRIFTAAAVALLAFVATVSGAEVPSCKLPHLFEAAAVPQGARQPPSQLQSADAFVLYKQCGQSWSNEELGTARGTTICDAGCAMSSVAMILKTRGVDVNPGTLNTWLKGHGGYEGGDELMWASVDKFGKTRMLNYYHGYNSMSVDKLAEAAKAGRGVVVNVRNGGHWVLVTGHIGGSTFRVNDPGFNIDSYTHAEMGNFVEYQ